MCGPHHEQPGPVPPGHLRTHTGPSSWGPGLVAADSPSPQCQHCSWEVSHLCLDAMGLPLIGEEEKGSRHLRRGLSVYQEQTTVQDSPGWARETCGEVVRASAATF